jgi:hypothetical protein
VIKKPNSNTIQTKENEFNGQPLTYRENGKKRMMSLFARENKAI